MSQIKATLIDSFYKIASQGQTAKLIEILTLIGLDDLLNDSKQKLHNNQDLKPILDQLQNFIKGPKTKQEYSAAAQQTPQAEIDLLFNNRSQSQEGKKKNQEVTGKITENQHDPKYYVKNKQLNGKQHYVQPHLDDTQIKNLFKLQAEESQKNYQVKIKTPLQQENHEIKKIQQEPQKPQIQQNLRVNLSSDQLTSSLGSPQEQFFSQSINQANKNVKKSSLDQLTNQQYQFYQSQKSQNQKHKQKKKHHQQQLHLKKVKENDIKKFQHAQSKISGYLQADKIAYLHNSSQPKEIEIKENQAKDSLASSSKNDQVNQDFKKEEQGQFREMKYEQFSPLEGMEIKNQRKIIDNFSLGPNRNLNTYHSQYLQQRSQSPNLQQQENPNILHLANSILSSPIVQQLSDQSNKYILNQYHYRDNREFQNQVDSIKIAGLDYNQFNRSPQLRSNFQIINNQSSEKQYEWEQNINKSWDSDLSDNFSLFRPDSELKTFFQNEMAMSQREDWQEERKKVRDSNVFLHDRLGGSRLF